MRDSDRPVDDGSPSGFKAFVVCRHDYGSSPVISFLAMRGLTLIIGLQKTLIFFARRQKWKGTAAFLGGITLILLRWPLTGFLVELYGILVLFGELFASWTLHTNVLGKNIRRTQKR